MHGSERDAVSAIAHEIADQVGQERFDLWFRESTKLELSDKQQLTVKVPNRFFLEWFKAHYQKIIGESATSVCGRAIAVRFLIDESLGDRREADPPAIPAPAVAEENGQGRPKTRHLARLEDVVVGPCNQLAYAAAQRVCEKPGQEFPLLFIHGGVGLGKTHLLEGIYNGLRMRHRSLRVAYLSAEEFTNDFLSALRGGSLPSFRRKCRSVHVLLIDGLQFLSNKQATQEEFLQTFKCLESDRRQIVVAADLHPRMIPWQSPELASRVASGMTCGLDLPDFETRKRILEARAARIATTISANVIRFVAEQVASNVRELEGALNTLAAYSKLLNVEMDLKTARSVLSNAVGLGARRVRIADIEQEVCSLFGLEPNALKSKGQSRAVSRPRMVAMYLARKHTQAALSEIGKHFGNRNHSTVISADKKVDGWIHNETTLSMNDSNWKINDVIEHLERRLCAS